MTSDKNSISKVMTQRATSTDEAFAGAIKSARERAQKTQEQVAAEMQSRGFSNFHQATIYKIEKGDRKVTVAEALELARIVGDTLDALTDPDAHSVSASRRRLFREGLEFGKALLDANAAMVRAAKMQNRFRSACRTFDDGEGEAFRESPDLTATEGFESLLGFSPAADFVKEFDRFLSQAATERELELLGFTISPNSGGE